jgi:penicillin amidase
VRQGDEFVPCEVRREVIEVKGAAPVVEEVMVTPRGPIIGPALHGEIGAISLRAVWLDPRPARGFLRLASVRDFKDFRREFEHWPLAPQNMAYADTSGAIGWQLIGEVPRRRKGWGTIPLPGRDTDAGWEDETIAFSEMPHALNPECGFIATANNKPLRDGEGPFLGVDWLDGYRVARIGEALATRDGWDVASTLALQMDEASLLWPELRETLLQASPAGEETRVALHLLGGWDGVVSSGSVAASIFEIFFVEMTRRVAKAKAPRSLEWVRGRGFALVVSLNTFTLGRRSRIVRLLREQPDGWFERPWPEEIAEALTETIVQLRRDHGRDSNAWSWGKVRPLTLRHSLGRGALAMVYNLGPLAVGGDGDTISQAGVNPLRPTGNPIAIASLRMVIDVGNWDESRFCLPGGQSGNPLSPHYDDLFKLWQRGEGVPIAWSDEAVRQATKSQLLLRPPDGTADTSG